MSEKIIERPYKVYTGTQIWEFQYPQGASRATIEWNYDKSFKTETDAEAYGDRVSEEYEFVKIEKRENN